MKHQGSFAAVPFHFSMIKIVLPITLCCLLFLSCKNDPKTRAVQSAPNIAPPKSAPAPPAGSATFALTEGTVNWSVNYTIGKKGHQGAINATAGELWVSQNQIISGTVTLDMNSIRVTDIKEPEKRLDLESHLKNADFFEVDKFPKAEFMFIEVAPSTLPNTNWILSGDLTMRGNTARVEIPVKVNIEGDILRAESPSFPINRTNWGVNFHSGLLGTTKDKMIDDMVSISLKVVAKKK